MIELSLTYRCAKCSHAWLSKIVAPLQCPSCKTRYWNDHPCDYRTNLNATLDYPGGWVYAATIPSRPWTKIGFTTRPDAAKLRMKELYYPYTNDRLTLVTMIPTPEPFRLEQCLHQRFQAELRHGAEWFELSGEQLKWLIELGKNPPKSATEVLPVNHTRKIPKPPHEREESRVPMEQSIPYVHDTDSCHIFGCFECQALGVKNPRRGIR